MAAAILSWSCPFDEKLRKLTLKLDQLMRAGQPDVSAAILAEIVAREEIVRSIKYEGSESVEAEVREKLRSFGYVE